MLRKYQGENLRSDSTLHIRSLPHDLVTGRIPHADSQQHPTLAWKIPWMEEPGGLQSMGSLRVRHD